MIVVDKSAARLRADGFVLLARASEARFARLGVPIYAQAASSSRRSVWVPRWAPGLVDALTFFVAALDPDAWGHELIVRSVTSAVLSEDPEGRAAELASTALLGGVEALEGALCAHVDAFRAAPALMNRAPPPARHHRRRRRFL